MKYIGSEKHKKNIIKAQKLALHKLEALKQERINKYYMSPNKCDECGSIIIYEKKNNKFCSSSCSVRFNNRNRKLTDETKNKISESVSKHYIGKEANDSSSKYVGKCVVCNMEFRRIRFENKRISKSKTCSFECRKKQRIENAKKSIKDRIENGLHKGWITRNIISYPEKFFIKVLDNNNIQYKHNYPINKRDLGLDDSCNYFLDFYIENKKIDLEIDGYQHKYRKVKDDKRDNILTENGYFVYRIKWKNINTEKGKRYIKEEIDKFLKYYNNI